MATTDHIGIERIFPESQFEEDLLAGLPDFTFGHALEYFADLNTDDRELVQWYVIQHVYPEDTLSYCFDMAYGYRLIDPDRVSTLGLEAARKELSRINRYNELFMTATSFSRVSGIVAKYLKLKLGMM
ncbi:hypothetical protein KDA00_00610 [Candidatus Saccharibacteria bacterium]|nr:hypothetical protein [Candidatus Saccharibacteria bacterium]